MRTLKVLLMVGILDATYIALARERLRRSLGMSSGVERSTRSTQQARIAEWRNGTIQAER